VTCKGPDKEERIKYYLVQLNIPGQNPLLKVYAALGRLAGSVG